MVAPAKARRVLGACMLVALVAAASADTLYLKNGMYIVVARATEKDGQIDYWVGSTKYTISKTLVTRIEPGNGPPVSNHSADRTLPAVQDLSHRDPDPTTANARHDRLQMPVPGGPKQSEPYWVALRGRILQGDRVNEIKLAEIELDGDPRTTSNAYFLAGVTEMQGGNPARASAYFASGLRVVSAVHPALASAALEAVQAERWEPGRVRGVAVEVPLRMTIDYILHARGR